MSVLSHVEHGTESYPNGRHLVERCRSDVFVQPGAKYRFDRQERQPAVRLEVDAEEASGVSIEYLRSDDHGEGGVLVDSFGAEDQAQ